MFRKSFFILLVSCFCFGLAVEHYIKKWRNELEDSIEYMLEDDVGESEEYKKVDFPHEETVNCIKNIRNNLDPEYAKTGITKLEDVFRFFGMCVCIYLKSEPNVSKCDATIDYSRTGLQYRHFQKFKVEQKRGTLKFFDQTNLPERTENVFVKTVTNRGSTKVTTTVALTFDKSDTRTTATSNEIGGSVGGSVELNFGIFSYSTEVEAGYSYSTSSEKEKSKTNSFSVEREFTIPSHSSRQIVCSVKKQDLDFMWEIPVIVTGHVAINMDPDNEEGYYIFVDVKYVAKFFKELSLTRDDPPKLQGFIRGRTRGSRHFDANAVDHPSDMTLTPVQENLCNPMPSKAKK